MITTYPSAILYHITLLAKVSATPLNEASVCLTGAFAGSMQPHVMWHQ
jgi:hypothetical protein